VGVSTVLYYLLRDDPEGQAALEAQADAESGDNKATMNEILQILQDMLNTQEKRRTTTQSIAKEVSEKPDIPLEQLYRKVKEAAPEDPLEARGIKPQDFEGVLQSALQDPHFQANPEVEITLTKLFRPQTPPPSTKAKTITAELVIKMHEFMLEELERFSVSLKDVQGSAWFDGVTISMNTMVAQAVMDGRRLAKFGVASDDLDAAIMLNQEKLSQDMNFMQVAQKFDQALRTLAGAPVHA